MYAACEGHIECLKLLEEWGATNLDGALVSAAGEEHVHCKKLLETWIKEQDKG